MQTRNFTPSPPRFARIYRKPGKIPSWLGAQDGVKEVSARVVEDIVPVSDWIEDEIARRTMI